MGEGESSYSDFSNPFLLPLTPGSPCLSVPHGFPAVKLPQRAQPHFFGSFDQLTLYSTQIANSFSLTKGNFSATIYFPLITTLSNLISSFFPKTCRILFTLVAVSLLQSGYVSGLFFVLSVCTTYICTKIHPHLKPTNTKLAKPSSRELGNAGVTVLSNLNSISLCLCLLESLTTSSHCHLILCTGCLPCSVPAWRELSWAAAIHCFCFLLIVQWVACASFTVHYSSPALKTELLVSSWVFLWLSSQQYLIVSQL